MLFRGRSSAYLLAITFAVAIGSVAWTGCQPAATPSPAAIKPAAESAIGETWDAVFIEGSRVGYTYTRVAPIDENNQQRLRITSESKLAINRYGEKSEQSFRITSVESLSGEPIRFITQTAFGPTPMETTGTVDASNGTLKLVTAAGGKTAESSMPLPPGCRGFFGADQTLREKPMAAGEHRNLQTLMPILNQVATVSLVAREKESIRLLDGSVQSLMRIDCLTSFRTDAGPATPDQSGPNVMEFASTLWTNDAGEMLKSYTDAMKQETYRTTREGALAEGDSKPFDLGTDTMVRIDPPLPNAHRTRQVRYAVEIDGGDPARVFANGQSQQVRSTGEHTAEITVTAVRPDRPENLPGRADSPADADRRPNSLVQSDDPRIVAIASKVVPNSTDAWEIAVGLEKWVHENLALKNYSQAFASAADVAESLEGDCSEHAVLLVALLRAREIPARGAAGLVYVEQDQAFGYHMWTEAYIRDRWIPLDATLGQRGIGGGHLKMLDTNLDGATAIGSLLPIVQVLGRLKVQVLETQ